MGLRPRARFARARSSATINTINYAILILISIYDVIRRLVSSWLCRAQIECFSRVAKLPTWHALLCCFQTGDVKQPHLIITDTYRPSHVICKHEFCHQLAVTTPSHWAWFIRVLCIQMLRFDTGFVSIWLFPFNRVLCRRSIKTTSKSITSKDRHCTTAQWRIQSVPPWLNLRNDVFESRTSNERLVALLSRDFQQIFGPVDVSCSKRHCFNSLCNRAVVSLLLGNEGC